MGVDTVIDIAMGTAESEAVAARAATLDGVFASVGIHPNDLAEFDADRDGAMAKIAALAPADAVVAIGETGIDLYRERSDREVQADAFRAHIGLARELDLALVIHCRDAHVRVLEVLDETVSPERVVMHCFSGDVAFARTCADRGYYCSFAGNLTYRRSEGLREAAAAVPLELLLVETDAPYLAPHPFRGKPNAPRLLPYTAATLAEVRGLSLEELSSVLRENSSRAFNVVV